MNNETIASPARHCKGLSVEFSSLQMGARAEMRKPDKYGDPSRCGRARGRQGVLLPQPIDAGRGMRLYSEDGSDGFAGFGKGRINNALTTLEKGRAPEFG